jgi:hypothetical protein
MIRGRYVATVVLEFNIDDSQPGMYPFEKIKENICGGDMEKELVAILSEELGEGVSVGLAKQYSDLYKVED